MLDEAISLGSVKNIHAGMRVVESYCHLESCADADRSFQRYVMGLHPEDAGLVYDGIIVLEEVVNPSTFS